MAIGLENDGIWATSLPHLYLMVTGLILDHTYIALVLSEYDVHFVEKRGCTDIWGGGQGLF